MTWIFLCGQGAKALSLVSVAADRTATRSPFSRRWREIPRARWCWSPRRASTWMIGRRAGLLFAVPLHDFGQSQPRHPAAAWDEGQALSAR
jgi:hypothetical protein